MTKALTSPRPWSPAQQLRGAFISVGILPILLVIALIFFGSMEARFYHSTNVFNVIRQSTFLIIVALGQLVVLLTAGIDLSVGATIGFVGVISAQVLISVLGIMPDATLLATVISILAGLVAGVVIGIVNGIGVALLKVSPFMMTLGVMTSLVGVSLSLTSGLPVTGVPDDFLRLLGYGRIFGITPPIIVTIVLSIAVFFLMNRTTVGRYFYAVGSNIRAAKLSGVKTTRQLFLAYVLAGFFSAVTGILFVARTGSAEALNGNAYTLQSVAACVIGGVSLFGGMGKVRDVLLGAFFITILTNGMNLIRVESYVQQIVLGIVLVLSLVADQIRMRLIA